MADPWDIDYHADYETADNRLLSYVERIDGQVTRKVWYQYYRPGWVANLTIKDYDATCTPGSCPPANDKRARYTYDFRGRRVRSWTETWSGSAWAFTTGGSSPDRDIRYVRDDWLLVEELDGANGNAVLRKYTWGLDLAGLNGSINDRTSAGGIGGLLAMEDLDPATSHSGSFWYCYDANGNVSQLVDADDGTIAVHYEYDPYGIRLNAPVSGELDQQFRFSTKPYDSLTGMYYYGYRWYSARLGRWVSRDPAGATGGFNFYRAL